ncbi:ABC transporter ATP-binding protein [Streptomyces sp. BA2]|uniref:ABC transporter ATP-binding protein n=1 Tax=Streptomyces sp. BA2 TaxID=436595 RepID=UPI001320B0B5|nr:ATP-binding cassette domain-containing protein [Streptomyces sp. BA2]MWA08420.1 ATP-binding cassette domain-containing protein [Streptomyces sp. BA2]
MADTAAPPALEAVGLRKSFGDFVAVDDVSLALAPGACLAVVGESGSGKTTTARMLAGLETPTGGTIRWAGRQGRPGAGRPWAGRRARAAGRLQFARHVQMVFQDPYASLDPHQRVGDCVGEVLTLHTGLRGPALAERVSELLDQVGLGAQQARSLPRALSGGQRQRVAIARALAVRPRVLILDEAVAALDVSVQAQIINLLREIREQTAIAYLFITHDLGIVHHICDDIVVMRRGRVVERGTTTAVLETPQHPYTIELLESVPRRGWTPRRRAAAAPGGRSGSGLVERP